MHNASFFVITGGPGAGKTTLLTELEQRGFKCIPEVARELIKEQVAAGGEALPWKDTGLYTRLMLERSVESYRQASQAEAGYGPAKPANESIFFDRGIPDTLCYARLINAAITGEMDQAARGFRYNKKVFMLPPWREIYQTDTERKQTWEDAVQTFQMMVDTYEMYDYQVIEVPKTAIKERAEFVLSLVSGDDYGRNRDEMRKKQVHTGK